MFLISYYFVAHLNRELRSNNVDVFFILLDLSDYNIVRVNPQFISENLIGSTGDFARLQ